jgi:hypothetical protein
MHMQVDMAKSTYLSEYNVAEIKKLENRFMLQSCSISEFDKKIILNTEVAKFENKHQTIENVHRKSIT